MIFHLYYICPYHDVVMNANHLSSLEAEAGGLQLLQGRPGLHVEHVSKTNKWKRNSNAPRQRWTTYCFAPILQKSIENNNVNWFLFVLFFLIKEIKPVIFDRQCTSSMRISSTVNWFFPFPPPVYYVLYKYNYI